MLLAQENSNSELGRAGCFVFEQNKTDRYHITGSTIQLVMKLRASA